MKILQVLHQFLPNHIGGIELYVRNISRQLIYQGNEVLVFCGEGDVLRDPEQRQEDLEGLSAFFIHNKKDTPKKRGDFFQTFKNSKVIPLFEQVISSFHPDIIHFHHTMYLSAKMIFFAQKKNIPTVLTIHDFWFLCHKLHLINGNKFQCRGPLGGVKCAFCFGAEDKGSWRWMKTLFYLIPFIYRTQYQLRALQSVDVLISPAKFIQKKISPYRGHNQQSNYIPYAIPIYKTPVTHARQIDKNHPKELRFGYLGTIKRHKGLHLLIEAFNGLVDQKATLNIYGDMAKDKFYYHELRQNCLNDRVFFKGPYDNQRLHELFKEIDVLIVPSIWPETGPMVILEALSNQVPVIASDLGGPAELIHDGKNGFLFKPGDSKSLLRCLQSILDNPSLLNDLSICFEKKYSIEYHVDELLTIYQGQILSRQQFSL